MPSGHAGSYHYRRLLERQSGRAEHDPDTICREAAFAAACTRDCEWMAALEHANACLKAGLRDADDDTLRQAEQTLVMLAGWYGAERAGRTTFANPRQLQHVKDFWDAVFAAYWQPDETEYIIAARLAESALRWGKACRRNLLDRAALKAFRRQYGDLAAAVRRAEGLS